MKNLHMIAFVLVIVGGLNWLLYGLFGWEIGEIFGGMSATISKIIYILVGLSAIWLLIKHKTDCNWCSGKMQPQAVNSANPGNK